MDMKSPAVINGSRYQLKAQWPTSNVAESKKQNINYPAFKQPLGYKKSRFRHGLAYTCNKDQGTLGLVVFDIKTHTRVGQCKFDKFSLSNIEVKTQFRHKKIGLTFLKIANILTANRVLFCTTLSGESDYRICTDGMGLLRHALSKNIIKSDQFVSTEPIFPIELPGYNLRPRKPKLP
jgi:hypothetical protein